MERKTLGHIDCPSCGTKGGMRITHDKNGEPFGFCEAECNQQMRIGGSVRRVALFVARYPWAGDQKPVSVPDAPEKKPASPVVEGLQEKPKPAPEKRRGFDMGL